MAMSMIKPRLTMGFREKNLPLSMISKDRWLPVLPIIIAGSVCMVENAFPYSQLSGIQ